MFQDKSVTSSIPDFFQNSEPPIFFYKYYNQLETLYSISINLCLILTSMQIYLNYESVKILILFTRQQVMLSLEI